MKELGKIPFFVRGKSSSTAALRPPWRGRSGWCVSSHEQDGPSCGPYRLLGGKSFVRPLLMKQKKRGKICFVIYIAGKRKLFFLFMKCL
jgi:hypothetical protein